MLNVPVLDDPLIVKLRRKIERKVKANARYQSTFDVAEVLKYIQRQPLDWTQRKEVRLRLAVILRILLVARSRDVWNILLQYNYHEYVRDGNSMINRDVVWIWIKRKGECWKRKALHRNPNCKEMCPIALLEKYIEITHKTHPVRFCLEHYPEKADRPPTPASPLWVSNTFQNKKTLFTVSYEAIRRDVSDFLASIPFLSGKGFMGHSLRGAVGSWLAECGVPIFAILSRGGWTSLSTFLRFYCRSLGNVNFTEILMQHK